MGLESKINQKIAEEFSLDSMKPMLSWDNGTLTLLEDTSENAERVCHTIESFTGTNVRWSGIKRDHMFDITDEPLSIEDRFMLGLDVPGRVYTSEDEDEAIQGITVLEGDVA